MKHPLEESGELYQPKDYEDARKIARLLRLLRAAVVLWPFRIVLGVIVLGVLAELARSILFVPILIGLALVVVIALAKQADML